jgi:hypothetical protein
LGVYEHTPSKLGHLWRFAVKIKFSLYSRIGLGNGTDTAATLMQSWPGTFALVNLRLSKTVTGIDLHKMMSEFRDAAARELSVAEKLEQDNRLHVSIASHFGTYAEDKQAAIDYRNRELIPAVNASKDIVVDFDTVVSAPHSFLSALLATPIRLTGMQAYKSIKIINAAPEIRETIDFILDENTKPESLGSVETSGFKG